MQSAEGQVQHLRYQATFPLLINVANQPTYFMALKDDAGLVKQFAMLDIQRYQNVAVGDTVIDCQKAYLALLATNGVTSGDVNTPGSLEIQGVIDHIAQAVVDGNSHFYVKLVDNDAIFDFALPSSIEIVGYKEGDLISFRYVESAPINPVEEIFEAPRSNTENASGGDSTNEGIDAAEESPASIGEVESS